MQPQTACFLKGLSCLAKEGEALLRPKASIMPKMNRFVAIQIGMFRDIRFLEYEKFLRASVQGLHCQ
jgi:hypothetical protein